MYTPKESYLFSDLSDPFTSIFSNFIPVGWSVLKKQLYSHFLEGARRLPFTTVMVYRRQAWYVRACFSSAFSNIS